MGKVTLGPQTLLYPMPALLVGANVNGTPNFMTVAWGGIACGEPPMISVAIRHVRHTLKGIKQSQTFSVNIPSVELVKETDYCGTVSGSKTDKVHTCRFDVFYGKLGSAPLIRQFPVNLECSVVQTLNSGSHALVIGRIEETHVSEECLTGGKPDVDKIKPLVYVTSPAARYQGLGEVVGKAWSVGKHLS
ncbi:MAG: flavin reductase family protein [Dehalococcoidia bacterium]|nr:flavin reductase family protein [Dehalococcoidia bacterium]